MTTLLYFRRVTPRHGLWPDEQVTRIPRLPPGGMTRCSRYCPRADARFRGTACEGMHKTFPRERRRHSSQCCHDPGWRSTRGMRGRLTRDAFLYAAPSLLAGSDLLARCAHGCMEKGADARIAMVTEDRRIQAELMFRCLGRALSHTPKKLPSRTILSWPQAGQRRKTTLYVKSPGCARPMPSSHGDCWPRIRVRTVTGVLVAYLADRPSGPFPGEKRLTGGQYLLPGRTVNVLAAPWR